jgi:hypothetical protein
MTRPADAKSVPVLVTWDVDPVLWVPLERRKWALNTAADLCHRHGINATFFFTAQPADVYLDDFGKMQAQGHEIGCHGLTHGDEEDYDRMSEPMQRDYIAQATEKLQNLVGKPIRAFRGPHVKTSATTLRLLASNGYLTDSSVCSQRLDLLSSNLINTGWIFSPRRPYRPHRDNAFKSGDLAIWEIPVSAAVVPFISSALRVLGLSAMKTLFKLLYAESRHTNKPIVYLAHPTEFLERKVKGKKRLWKLYTRREYFTPSFIHAHGLRLRSLLYRIDGETLCKNTQELFAYVASFPNVRFMTVSEYAICHLGEASASG